MSTFFCHGCQRHKDQQFLARTRAGRKECDVCQARAKQRPDDVVGTYPDGNPLLRRHVQAHRSKRVARQYTQRSTLDYLAKLGR